MVFLAKVKEKKPTSFILFVSPEKGNEMNIF